MTAGGILYLASAIACAGLGALGTAAWAWREARWPRALWAASATLLLALVLLAWGHRFTVAGHLPIFGTYESALSLAVAVLGAAFIYEWRGGFRIGLTPLAALLTAGLLLHGLRFNQTIYALTISERSLVVDLHAALAWSAFGVLATNAALALLTIRGSGRTGSWLVPTLKLGFALHSGMMATGSLYKFMLFGRAWSFDPMEILGFIAWIAYGTLLHLALLAGWRPERLARFCLFVFLLLVVSYRLIVYFPAWSTYHILDVDLRLHLVR